MDMRAHTVSYRLLFLLFLFSNVHLILVLYIPNSPRLIHRSGKNRVGSGKYSSEFDTAKCGKMTCVYVVPNEFVRSIIEHQKKDWRNAKS